jgi:hypothetical protein
MAGMDGLTKHAASTATEAIRDLMRDRNLEVWVEVRDSAGNSIYSYCAASGVQLDDKVTVTHQVGAVEVEG